MHGNLTKTLGRWGSGRSAGAMERSVVALFVADRRVAVKQSGPSVGHGSSKTRWPKRLAHRESVVSVGGYFRVCSANLNVGARTLPIAERDWGGARSPLTGPRPVCNGCTTVVSYSDGKDSGGKFLAGYELAIVAATPAIRGLQAAATKSAFLTADGIPSPCRV